MSTLIGFAIAITFYIFLSWLINYIHNHRK